MTDVKGRDLLDKLKDKNLELKNRQTIIKRNNKDNKKLELFLLSLSESTQQIETHYDKNYKDEINHQEKLDFHKRIEELISEIDEWIINLDKKIDHFFDDIYEKIPGYFFGIIGIFIFLSSTFIAVVLYLYINPNYSIFHNWISDLGTGPNGANIVFNTGWILSSGLIFLFHIYEIRILKKKSNKKHFLELIVLSNMAFTFGIFLVGVFPENLLEYHIIAATFYFLGGFSFFSLYGIIALLNKKVPITHAFIAFLISISYILFFLSPYFPQNFSEIGLTITSMEWLTLFTEGSMMLVILEHTLLENYILKKYKKEMENIKNGRLNESKFKTKLLKFIEAKYIE